MQQTKICGGLRAVPGPMHGGAGGSRLFIQTTSRFVMPAVTWEEKLGDRRPRPISWRTGPDHFDFWLRPSSVTSQVSDVQVTSREMPAVSRWCSVLSFGFNMLIVALNINGGDCGALSYGRGVLIGRRDNQGARIFSISIAKHIGCRGYPGGA
jgi:hypothetical protein